MSQTNKLKIVLDTNVLLSIIGKTSKFHFLWNAILNRKFSICISTSILLEYEEQLKLRFSETFSDLVLLLLAELPEAIFVSSSYQWNLIEKDADDNKFVDTAIAAQADFIVTHDKHFDILKTLNFPKVNVIDTTQLVQLLNPTT